jgi:glc operon protein GlcG
MKNTSYFILALLMMAFTHQINAQQMNIKLLNLEDAQKMADAAEAKARQENWNVVIVVLDAGGHLITLRRMDGTQIGSVEVAMKKADTALKFKRPTKVFEDAVKGGNVHIISLPGVVAVEGGLPISHEGNVIGSIGISGVTSAQDGMIAAAALESFK